MFPKVFRGAILLILPMGIRFFLMILDFEYNNFIVTKTTDFPGLFILYLGIIPINLLPKDRRTRFVHGLLLFSDVCMRAPLKAVRVYEVWVD